MFNIQKLEKFLFNLFVFFTGLSLVIPLIYIKNVLRPFIVGKMIPFQIIVLILLFIWIILLSINWKKYLPKLNFLTISLFVFVLIVFLSSVFGENFYRSFWGNAERMDGFLALLHFFVFFLSVHSVLKNNPIVFKKLIFFSLGISFLATIYPALQKFGLAFTPPGEKFDRPAGSFGNPTFLSGYLLIHLFLGFWYLLIDWAKKRKFFISDIVIVVFLIVDFIGLIWTQTRGSWLGLFLGIIVFLVISIFVLPKKLKISFLVLLILILISGGLFFGFKDRIKEISFLKGVPVVSRLANISFDDDSTKSRLLSWKWSLEWWKQKPILGVGQDMFYHIFDKNYNPDNYKMMSERFDRSHNKFIDVLVMNGILGLLSYLIFFSSIFWLISRKIKNSDNYFEKMSWITIISLFVSYIVHIFFVFETPGNSVLFFFLVAGLVSLPLSNVWDKKYIVNIRNREFKIAIFSIISIVIISILFYLVDYKPYRASYFAFQAAAGNPLEIQKVDNYYNLALKENTFINSELIKMKANHFLSILIYSFKNEVPIESEILKQYSDNLVKTIEKGIERENLIDFHIFPTMFYTQLSWRNDISEKDRQYYLTQSNEWFSKISQTWSKRNDYLVIQAENEFFRKNFDKAEEINNQLLKTTPNFGRVVWLQGIILVAKGDLEKGTEKMTQAMLKGYRISDKRNTDTFIMLMSLIKEEDKEELLDLMNYHFNITKENEIIEEKDLIWLAELNAELFVELKGKKIERLIQYLETYLSQRDKNADYWAKLAASYGMLHNQEKAIWAAKKAVAIDPENYQSSSKMFIQLLENENWEKLGY
jgi:O-antigen ligase